VRWSDLRRFKFSDEEIREIDGEAVEELVLTGKAQILRRQGLLTWARVLVALALFAIFASVVFELSGSERLWLQFERFHHCQMSGRRGEWATYVCDDGLIYSRRK
jgi:hypothetical protein